MDLSVGFVGLIWSFLKVWMAGAAIATPMLWLVFFVRNKFKPLLQCQRHEVCKWGAMSWVTVASIASGLVFLIAYALFRIVFFKFFIRPMRLRV